ncbi:hypothetical protein BJ165DRAFT_1577339 [Panaeolus papilionaceus]|nr:hypothetical protein BJ165DRAFT_1577339 [Panaeolus papilionaceus]
MDSFRKLRTRVFPDKERERKKIVRRSHSLPQMSLHPRYFGSTPLTVENIRVHVPLNTCDARQVTEASHHGRPDRTVTNGVSSTAGSPPGTGPMVAKPTQPKAYTRPTQASLNKPLPPIQVDRSTPQRTNRIAPRKVEKPVPVPMLQPSATQYRNMDIINQFPTPPRPSLSNYPSSSQYPINHADKEPLLARQIRRPTDPAGFIPPPIPAFDTRTRIREIKIQMSEPDADPFRRVIPNYAVSGSTPNLLRSWSTSNRTVQQDLPKSWSELGRWTRYQTDSSTSEHMDESTLLMRHKNLSSKSLGPNVVFKSVSSRQPVLVHKKSSSFATPGYWPEPNHPSHIRLESNASAPPRVEQVSRSNSLRVPRLGVNTPQHYHDDPAMLSTGSARSVQSNISALSRAKKLPRRPLERDPQNPNMISTGSSKSFMSIRDNLAPQPHPQSSRNVLRKPTKPQDPKKPSSSNMLSTDSSRSIFSTRSNLVPESERKPRLDIKLPTPLQPFKRRT